MIIKKLIYIAIAASLGFTIERKVIHPPPPTTSKSEHELHFAAEVGNSMTHKRGVFGQDLHGQFFSLYEKDPDHPELTIVKYVRAKKGRHNGGFYEYFEFDSKSSPKESQDKGLFYLSENEITKRLIHNGTTY